MQATFTLPSGFDPTQDSILINPFKAAPPPAPPPAPAFDLSLPIADIGAYLTQHILPDGSPALVPGTGRPQTVYDTMTWRRRDYGQPGGYEAFDALVDYPHGRWVSTWSFAPYKGFAALAGDGGETFQPDSRYVYIMATQDGGTPGIQKFTGSQQGGTGWIAFDYRPPTGSWASALAMLNINGATPLNPAFTRWRREMLPVYFRVFGVPATLSLPCIISEHYNGSTIANAVSMEQQIYALGWGPVWWAAYGTGAGMKDYALRVPAAPWGAAAERSDFVIEDGRLWTDITLVAPGEQNKVAWPPAGFVP
jgi:hypothetical protein